MQHDLTKCFYSNISRSVAEVYLTDPGSGSSGQVQVQRGEAELDLDLTWTTWAGVARGSPPPTPLKSTKAKSRYNEAKPSCTWTWPRWTWAEVAQGGKQVHRGAAEMYLLSSECNFSAMLMRRKASTPRRSRGVLVIPPNHHCIGVCGGHRVQLQSIVDEEEASTTRRSRVVLDLLPNQQCWGVGGGLPSATPAQCWRGERQVHRGEAEVYLPYLRVSIAPGSVRYTSATERL